MVIVALATSLTFRFAHLKGFNIMLRSSACADEAVDHEGKDRQR